eukprot:CAMPEP_0194161240 /NCGR_PEP_ID=MMETSP0152-20130528/78835_1 /TAXON_ID=1049557 /ORGANISM="Thalassiothrix antarctica, Strain L6-D1" /LENGTH=368 /DNA_ID=CAMNT_0038871011 /DNA_START=231 /DNA_END=1334 /DNA_ORIENTATION=+
MEPSVSSLPSSSSKPSLYPTSSSSPSSSPSSLPTALNENEDNNICSNYFTQSSTLILGVEGKAPEEGGGTITLEAQKDFALKMFGVKDIFEGAIETAYDQVKDQLCGKRSIDSVGLDGIYSLDNITENIYLSSFNNVTNATNATTTESRYLQDVDDDDIIDDDTEQGSNITLSLSFDFKVFFRILHRCLGCPTDFKLFNDASRRRRMISDYDRTLQDTSSSSCFCDDDDNNEDEGAEKVRNLQFDTPVFVSALRSVLKETEDSSENGAKLKEFGVQRSAISSNIDFEGNFLEGFKILAEESGSFDFVESFTDMTVEDTPSTSDSNLPSTLPSNLPSTLPTNLPSTLPSNLPSTLPSNLPSMFPSTIPT